MSKRIPLKASTAAAARTAIVAKESVTTAHATGQTPVDETYAGSAINLRKADWRMLRRVAEARVDSRGGGRPSVSKVIERLIDDNRQALESEIISN
jgi:hypothetical protein